MALAGVWEETFPFRALRGFVWVDTLVKTPAWRRRHSRRACFPDHGRGGAAEGALPAHHSGCWGARATRRGLCRNSVHKCPKTAPRDRFRQSVYTPASPHGRSFDRAGLRVPRVGDHHVRRQLESKTHALAGQTPPVLRLKAARRKTGGVVGHTAFERVCCVRRCHARSERYSWTTTTSPISVRS